MDGSDIEQLIDLYGTDIYRFCRKLSASLPDAQDLYQQTFLKLLEMPAKIDWNHNPKALLFTVTNSLWKNELRKSARRNRLAPSIPLESADISLSAPCSDTETDVLKKIQSEHLHHYINELNEKYRIPIILYYSFELSIEDIGKIVKVPKGTVKSRLYKGRKLLKERWEGTGYETYTK